MPKNSPLLLNSSMKMMNIHFYFLGYEHSKGVAIIQGFTAH